MISSFLPGTMQLFFSPLYAHKLCPPIFSPLSVPLLMQQPGSAFPASIHLSIAMAYRMLRPPLLDDNRNELHPSYADLPTPGSVYVPAGSFSSVLPFPGAFSVCYD